jgi:hypothetical protein
MRSDEVSRGPIDPIREGDPTALAEHLAACPACGSWSEASARLDGLWEATRPPEPGPDAWARVWSEVAAGHELAPEPVTLRLAAFAPDEAPSRPRPRRRWLVPAVAGAFVAQAAAVFLAAWVLFRADRPEAPVPVERPVATAPQAVVFELDEGETLFLVLDEQEGRVVCRPQHLATADLVAFDGESPDPYAVAFQSDLEMLNTMESLAW